MTCVKFYLIDQSGDRARKSFACRLAEKVYKLKKTVHILAASRDDAEHVDELLWTFRDGSFVPHHVVGGPAGIESPVTIGCESDEIPTGDLLINLCDEVPPAAESFPSVAELVTSDEDCKLRSRARYAAYRDQGYEIETHNV